VEHLRTERPERGLLSCCPAIEVAVTTRVRVVVQVDDPADWYRPRWADSPISPRHRELSIVADGRGGSDVRLIMSASAASALFQLLEAVIAEGPS
jgi:hypothetical protein